MAAAVLFYLRFVRRPGLPVNEESLTATLIIRVIIPLFFLLVSLAIFRKYAFRYPLGTIAACIVFPYCAVVALESAIGRSDDRRSAVLLYAVFIYPLIFGFAGAATYYSPRSMPPLPWPRKTESVFPQGMRKAPRDPLLAKRWLAFLRNHRVGYKTGLAAGCMALPWLIWSEGFPFNFQMVNSWITLNLTDRDDLGNILLAGAKNPGSRADYNRNRRFGTSLDSTTLDVQKLTSVHTDLACDRCLCCCPGHLVWLRRAAVPDTDDRGQCLARTEYIARGKTGFAVSRNTSERREKPQILDFPE
jgi:hypothetical protein